MVTFCNSLATDVIVNNLWIVVSSLAMPIDDRQYAIDTKSNHNIFPFPPAWATNNKTPLLLDATYLHNCSVMLLS